MKRFIILLFLVFVCNDLKAQIYHSEVCFYIGAGESLTENTTIFMYSFDGQEIKWINKTKSEITTKLKESPDYWDDWVPNHGISAEYDSDLSTYSREVYTSTWKGQMTYYSNPSNIMDYGFYYPTIGTMYRAFSKDLSSFIFWKQRTDSETIVDKKHYKRIDKSELMPNENLYDFLND